MRIDWKVGEVDAGRKMHANVSAVTGQSLQGDFDVSLDVYDAFPVQAGQRLRMELFPEPTGGVWMDDASAGSGGELLLTGRVLGWFDGSTPAPRAVVSFGGLLLVLTCLDPDHGAGQQLRSELTEADPVCLRVVSVA